MNNLQERWRKLTIDSLENPRIYKRIYRENKTRVSREEALIRLQRITMALYRKAEAAAKIRAKRREVKR